MQHFKPPTQRCRFLWVRGNCRLGLKSGFNSGVLSLNPLIGGLCMKVLPLFALCACAIARAAFGQAFGESIQLSQPAVHKTGAAATVSPNPLNSRSGMPQQSGVQVVNDMYRGQPDCHCAQAPMFLPSPREIPAGTPVILSSPSPNAVIYYTIDGWTPTESSTQYREPIVVNGPMRIQAYSQEPGKAPSPIVA